MAVAGFVTGAGVAGGGSPVALEGKLVTIHSDDFAQAQSSFEYRLETDQDTYELRLEDRRP